MCSWGQENTTLITPYDKDTIDTHNPLLAWFYMDGPSTNSHSSYRIIIVELQPEQSAEAGVIVNSPLVKMDRIQGTQLFYPYDAPELIPGHRYGWQIQRVQDNVLIDKSEAWEFILRLPEEPNYVKYVSLKTKGDATNYEAVGGKIFFKMEEKYQSQDLDFFIYDENMEIINQDIKDDSEEGETSGQMNVKNNGSNFYELDLGGMAKAGTYTLVLLDARKRKYKLKFFVR
jgi:hypothetical protein